MNVLEVVKNIKQIGEKNKCKSQKTRFVTDDNLKIGQCYRQGDLYVFRVADDHPVGTEIKRNQIADGVSIGARHLLNGDFRVYEGIKAPDCVRDLNAEAGIGYAFDVLSPTTVNPHPEHDNYVFKITGRFQVVHQLDVRTLSRVED